MRKNSVAIFGDSVAENYREYIKEELVDWDVYTRFENSKFSLYLLKSLQDYKKESNGRMFDAIIFNVGLWDIMRLSNEDRCFTSPEEYRENLKRIVNRIKILWPQTKIFFANTTSVIEPSEFIMDNEIMFYRYNKDIVFYNLVAKEVMEKLDIKIIDLYSCSLNISKAARSDSVHFGTPEGAKCLGIRCIEDLLAGV